MKLLTLNVEQKNSSDVEYLFPPLYLHLLRFIFAVYEFLVLTVTVCFIKIKNADNSHDQMSSSKFFASILAYQVNMNNSLLQRLIVKYFYFSVVHELETVVLKRTSKCFPVSNCSADCHR